VSSSLKPSQPVEVTQLFGIRRGVVNLGLEGFAEATRAQSVPTVHLSAWRPPAGGDEAVVRVLLKVR
jgi:hypothetical protein